MAYNTLATPVAIDCPLCQVRSHHSLQFGAAASYDGDATGRFALRLYNFGDKLAWWPRTDPRYAQWRRPGSDGDIEDPQRDSFVECLEVTCPNCLSGLHVMIGFESLYLVGIADVLPATDTPPTS